MRRPLIVGNWKMNGSVNSAAALLQAVLATPRPAEVEAVVCPAFVHLPLCRELLAASNIGWGAQNISDQPSGAFTGEVSGAMLAELGCGYVIVGHSERRALFGEVDATVVQKAKQAIANGVVPIACVGETLQERERGDTDSVIAAQVTALLDGLSAMELEQLVLAYEPIWAIGTGKTASPEQAQQVHAFIRRLWGEHAKGRAMAARVRVLYGGSVKADNARPIFAQPDVDGGLVGGASLDAEQFTAIITAASRG